ncbi:cell division protein FtsL [Geobacter hydrogenophilus]|uniref:Cell division protein FtsL n=2 Tax=Geobacter TaxID=28231 RepID=Q39YM6_GEOMG|nr:MULTISPECIES: cell division protein FtsL [Geobacter]ABB30648.1 cell division septum formation protein FtsL, putative [Geobacter metallireducens GS-15]EHP88035.1 cell division protein FtsL [Geobacter metallireducens RCH3]MBT0894269.1 cell division protein FtsL [Geobacter hydrogenophilus]MBT1076436.1 cell division protein FtsL [Geobacter grbiciae]GLI38445.1 cell division protein FtsL [Geobacter hydrogenophilus]
MAQARTDFTKVAAPKKLEAMYAQRGEMFPFLLAVMVLLTLVSVFHVWSRVRVIDLNLEIAEANRFLKEAQEEQNRLRLEVASLKTPARIEALAKGDLGMALPTDQQVVVVK